MPAQRTRQKPEAGLTLIECLACIVILGTAVVAGVSLTGIQAEVVAGDELNVLATRFLQRELEYLDGVDYEAIVEQTPTAVPEDGRFYVSCDIHETAKTYKEITLTIEWSSQNGVKQTETLSTLRCKNTLD